MKIDIDIKEDGKNVIINYNKKKHVFDFDKLLNSDKEYLGECDLKDYYYEPVEFFGKKAYLVCKNKKLYITFHLNKFLVRKSFMFGKIFRKNILFWGYYSEISNKVKDCDYLYLNDKIVGKLKRPFRFSIFKHFAIAKIKVSDVLSSDQIHSDVMVGDKNHNYLSMRMKKFHKGIYYYSRKRIGNKYLILRSTIDNDRFKIVHIDMQPEYERKNVFKMRLALVLSKIIGKKDVVLMFEKETNRACESGYYVFEKINQLKNLKTKVYFVINKDCADYNKVKTKYPNRTLEKYSIIHYLYIFISKYFVSSELSNHVINTRIYFRSINNELARKPLVFLQHGIMFSKPVDNPAASGFYKGSEQVNYYKAIISSELEATQFYKCGFERSDLIKCGLPKFDVSTMDKDADKIMVMLTYRFWEEALIMNNENIKETSYYKTYMKIVKAFEKAGLLDKLVISCHPKFAKSLSSIDEKYSKIVQNDVSAALKKAKIYITDYSSASYDAHYRGAYIIYYWAEKDYLIENYKAIPPIDETNCDGVPVYSCDELVKEVKNAIKKNYKMDKKYEDRYKKINEYHDNKNGDRLIKELLKLKELNLHK